MSLLSTNELEKLLVSPFYCIQIDEDLTMIHKSLISEELWISANVRLIREIGAEKWLLQLLEVLQGDYVRDEFICDDCVKHCDCA